MQYSAFLKTLTIATTVILALSACGSSDSKKEETTTTNDSISGEVMAPGGIIAQIEQHKPVMLTVIDYLFPAANAAITGLTGVPNVTVELIRIADNGNQLGSVLASTTTNGLGEYTLTLPAGVEPSANLVVQISGATETLRAVVSNSNKTVDINPVSQFILDSLINEGVTLSQLNIQSVQKLVDDVAQLNINFSGTTLAQVQSEIQNNTALTQTITTEVGTVANSGLINGAWDTGGSTADGRMAVFYPNGFYLVYSVNVQDCPNGGVEYGNYSYDGSSLHFTATVDENGQCGFVGSNVVSATYATSITDNGNTINITSGNPEDGTASFARVTDGNPDSIVGGWAITEAGTLASDTLPIALVFYPNGNYAHWQDANTDCSPGGIEYGTYSFDAIDNTLSGTALADPNDCGLSSNGSPGQFTMPATVTVTNNVFQISEGNGSSLMLDRLETSSATGSTN